MESGVGRCEIPVYNLNCDFCGRKVKTPYGNLPEALDITLIMAITAILAKESVNSFARIV